MQGSRIFQGTALQLVDDKGRVAIPSSLRQTLFARNPGAPDPKDLCQVVIGFHGTDRCLIGYDPAYSETLYAQLEERARTHSGPDGAPNDMILRAGLAGEIVPFDGSGRFIMPPFARRRAKIAKYAFFHGVGSHFEIWDPAELLASDTAADVMKDAVRFYLEDRGEAL
ncbi:MAG: division/cell wall cluster transcriptional repressor MraZ [Sphingomonas sp.]